MPVVNRIADLTDELTGWRRHLHANPEIAFQEHETSKFIAERLSEIGVDEVHQGLAGTGLVALIHGAGGAASSAEDRIALRADIDALPMDEKTGLPHASTKPGAMHACGHDGHTTILLGTAKYLAETRNFTGTAVLIFQPAEENGGGAKVMMDEGLFEQFPVRSVWGLHNSPAIPVGKIATRVGPSMAAVDDFTITISGRGGHAARPHDSIDPIFIGTQLYQSLQGIISRNTNPILQAVLSVTQFQAGSAFNVIPDDAVLAGTVRTFDAGLRDDIEARIRQIAQGVAQQFGTEISIQYDLGYPPLVNHAAETGFAGVVAADVVGEEHVLTEIEPIMGAEDFAYMLEAVP
ncbi:MAG: M20 aminoacylase family protein, partial [Pseudomonadota bacterium]